MEDAGDINKNTGYDELKKNQIPSISMNATTISKFNLSSNTSVDFIIWTKRIVTSRKFKKILIINGYNTITNTCYITIYLYYNKNNKKVV